MQNEIDIFNEYALLDIQEKQIKKQKDDCCCFVFLDRILNLKSITKEQAKELATYIVKV